MKSDIEHYNRLARILLLIHKDNKKTQQILRTVLNPNIKRSSVSLDYKREKEVINQRANAAKKRTNNGQPLNVATKIRKVSSSVRRESALDAEWLQHFLALNLSKNKLKAIDIENSNERIIPFLAYIIYRAMQHPNIIYAAFGIGEWIYGYEKLDDWVGECKGNKKYGARLNRVTRTLTSNVERYFGSIPSFDLNTSENVSQHLSRLLSDLAPKSNKRHSTAALKLEKIAVSGNSSFFNKIDSKDIVTNGKDADDPNYLKVELYGYSAYFSDITDPNDVRYTLSPDYLRTEVLISPKYKTYIKKEFLESGRYKSKNLKPRLPVWKEMAKKDSNPPRDSGGSDEFSYDGVPQSEIDRVCAAVTQDLVDLPARLASYTLNSDTELYLRVDSALVDIEPFEAQQGRSWSAKIPTDDAYRLWVYGKDLQGELLLQCHELKRSGSRRYGIRP
jgi:hypothetical protein